MYEKEEKNFLEKFIDTGKYLIKRQVKRAFRKLMKILLPFIGGFLLIFFAAFIVLGAAESFGDAVKDMVQGSSEHSDKSQAAINHLMDDSEQMYQLIMDEKIDLSALSFAMLDEATVKRIFERIHDYNKKLAADRVIVVTYRREKQKDDKGKIYTFDEMDLYGTIPNDETQSALNITYDNELWANVKLNHMEYEMEMDASKTFDVRWQPIFAMCAVVAKDNYDHWGNDTDLGSTSLKDADLSNYFLSNAQINDIIEIFYYDFEFHYNPVEEGPDTYEFTDFLTQESSYKLNVWVDVNGDRNTQRVPSPAPHLIKNSYISYEYFYDQETQQCTSREKVINPAGFFSAAKAVDPDFDMEHFLLNLSQLPMTDNMYEYYSSDAFINCEYRSELATTESKCGVIGTFYNGTLVSGGGGQAGTVSGETFGIPYYDYENPNTAHLGEVHFFAIKEPGEAYGVYRVSISALKPFTVSDNLSLDQIEYVLANSSYHANSGCILFNSAENRAKTAQVLYDYQEQNNVSVLFYLAIMRTEGAIKGSYGKTYYNYFNFTSSTYIIPGSSGFRDYKAEYGENGAWEALRCQLSQIYERYAVNRGQINYFLMCWRGYDGYNWGSISMSYCPAFDDTSMPWATGSYYIKNGTRRDVGGPNNVGWVNSNVSYRDALEDIVRGGYPDWVGQTFTSDDVLDSYYGPQLSEWIAKLQ